MAANASSPGGMPNIELGRYLPSAIYKQERLLVAVGHSKPAIPVSATSGHQLARLRCQLWVDSGGSGGLLGYGRRGGEPTDRFRSAPWPEQTWRRCVGVDGDGYDE